MLNNIRFFFLVCFVLQMKSIFFTWSIVMFKLKFFSSPEIICIASLMCLVECKKILVNLKSQFSSNAPLMVYTMYKLHHWLVVE